MVYEMFNIIFVASTIKKTNYVFMRLQYLHLFFMCFSHSLKTYKNVKLRELSISYYSTDFRVQLIQDPCLKNVCQCVRMSELLSDR